MKKADTWCSYQISDTLGSHNSGQSTIVLFAKYFSQIYKWMHSAWLNYIWARISMIPFDLMGLIKFYCPTALYIDLPIKIMKNEKKDAICTYL